MSGPYQAVCPTCGPLGPAYSKPRPAANIVEAHVCDELCLHCATFKGRSDQRGLCHNCYRDLDIRIDYPRSSWSADDLLDDWDILRRQGCTLREGAIRLGVTYAALDRALCRAKRRGDPRAIRSGVQLDRREAS